MIGILLNWSSLKNPHRLLICLFLIQINSGDFVKSEEDQRTGEPSTALPSSFSTSSSIPTTFKSTQSVTHEGITRAAEGEEATEEENEDDSINFVNNEVRFTSKLFPEDSLSSNPSFCPPPNVTFNGSLISEAAAETAFKGVRQVEFQVRIGPFETDRQKCKLTCERGQWNGPLCKRSQDTEYSSPQRSCEINFQPPDTVVTYQFRQLTLNASVLVPHGGKLDFRCESGDKNLLNRYKIEKDDKIVQGLGYFAMEGNATLECADGMWNHRIPFCRRTSGEKEEFSEDLAPQILVKVLNGHSTVGSAGQLLVYPGAIVHLDCVFNRMVGNPEWIWTNERQKDFPVGWSVSPGEEKNWRYRLSLYYVQLEGGFSNSYTCKTPKGKSNSIRIQVTDVECGQFHISDVDLESRLDLGRKIGAHATFSCPQGYKLKGVSKIHCLGNGQWSGEPPYCEPIQCHALEIADPHLRVLSLNNSFRGETTFLCPFGYQLIGRDKINCGHDGKWSHRVPKCQSIVCPPPLAPFNGEMVDRGRYLVGDSVQYLCNEGFVLIGEPFIRCTERGIWSHATPFCKRACRFPGDPRHGRVTPMKFLYEISDKILVQCDPGYVNTGRQKLTCQEDGTWTDRIPACISYLSASP